MSLADTGRAQTPTAPAVPVRVALDLLGGDGAPEVVTAAVAAWLSRADGPADGVGLVLVGPPSQTRHALHAYGVDPDHDALTHVPAQRTVGMADAPVSAVRLGGDVGIRVAAELVRDDAADVLVSAGHTGAAVVATSLVWGRESGVERPALSVTLPGDHGPVLLLDVGASPDATPEVLLSHAAVGLRRAAVLGLPDPRVGLLTIGSEAGKGDRLRRETDPLLRASLGSTYAGPVEAHEVVRGTRAQVVVTDGFTGNVLLKGLEGAVRWTLAVAAGLGPAAEAADAWRVEVGRSLGPPHGAGVLLGVRGDAVLAHGAARPRDVVTALDVAVHTVRAGARPVPSPLQAAAGGAEPWSGQETR